MYLALRQNLPTVLGLAVMVVFSQGAVKADEASESGCSDNFYLLEKSLLSNTQNRFELLRAFFPPGDPHPVFAEVTYRFVNETTSEEQGSDVWYWSTSEFYFVQPLEIFQYTALFFANFGYRQTCLELQLAATCAGASHEKMELLTQRLQLYAQSASTSASADTQKISELYSAVAACQEDIEKDMILSNFVKVWLHLFLILFPLGTALMLYICDPIQLLLGEKTWQKLEEESSHPTIAALIQISVLFTVFVFVVDIMGLIATVKSDFLSYDSNSAFYLSVITGLIFDVVAFGWVMFVLATSCHWDCKNMWYRWRNQPCVSGSSERIKKLMCSVMLAPAVCVANHLHYIVLAVVSDPNHAGSIGIFYFLTFVLFYITFRQFYARVVLYKGNGKLFGETAHLRPRPSQRSLARDNKDSSIRLTPKRVAFNTQAVICSLFLIGPIVMLYEAMFIILLLALPITKALVASPTRIYVIYQGTGIMIVALLTYSILLKPSGFSLSKAIQRIGKEFHLPEKIRKWNRLTDEEKSAFVVRALYEKPGVPSERLENEDIATFELESAV